MGEIRRALSALIVVVWIAPSSARPGPFEPQCPPPVMFLPLCARAA